MLISHHHQSNAKYKIGNTKWWNTKYKWAHLEDKDGRTDEEGDKPDDKVDCSNLLNHDDNHDAYDDDDDDDDDDDGDDV